MATFVNDTFTDADGTTLAAHVGETGATWTAHPNGSGACQIKANKCTGDGANITRYYASGAPAGADYSVQADFFFDTLEGSDYAAIWARLLTASDNGYQGDYYQPNGALEIRKTVAGVQTIIGTSAFVPTLGATNTMKLTVAGTSLTFFKDGVSTVTATDSSLAGAGKAGLSTRFANAIRGLQLDNFVATDASAAVPANTTPPHIQGTASLDSTVLATGDAWTNTPTSFTRQWYRNGVAIAAATGQSYRFVSADVGQSITAGVVAINGGGSSAEAVSAAVVPVALIPAPVKKLGAFAQMNRFMPGSQRFRP